MDTAPWLQWIGQLASPPRLYSHDSTKLITGENHANSRWEFSGDFVFI